MRGERWCFGEFSSFPSGTWKEPWLSVDNEYPSQHGDRRIEDLDTLDSPLDRAGIRSARHSSCSIYANITTAHRLYRLTSL